MTVLTRRGYYRRQFQPPNLKRATTTRAGTNLKRMRKKRTGWLEFELAPCCLGLSCLRCFLSWSYEKILVLQLLLKFTESFEEHSKISTIQRKVASSICICASLSVTNITVQYTVYVMYVHPCHVNNDIIVIIEIGYDIGLYIFTYPFIHHTYVSIYINYTLLTIVIWHSLHIHMTL